MTTKSLTYLANCLLDGQYTTARATNFWSQIISDRDLAGERKIIGPEVNCYPVLMVGRTLLVSLTDTSGKVWYAWVRE